MNNLIDSMLLNSTKARLWSVLVVIPCLLFAQRASNASDKSDNDKESPWILGVAVGYGQRSNPLVQSEDITLYFSLDLAYLGEYIFFDNGDFGVYLFESENLSVNAIVSYANDREYHDYLSNNRVGFDIFNTVNDDETADGGNDDLLEDDDPIGNDELPEPTPPPLIPDDFDIPKRNYAIEAGLEALYESEYGHFHVQWLYDVSNTFNGSEIWASYGLDYRWGDWLWYASLGFSWKSEEFVRYYYGVTEEEAQELNIAYEGESALNPFFSIGLKYHLSKSWAIGGVIKHETLGQGIESSPIINEGYVNSFFMGIKYYL